MSFRSSLKESGRSGGLADKTSPSPSLCFFPFPGKVHGAGTVPPSMGHGTGVQGCPVPPPRGRPLELVQVETLPRAAVSSTFCSEILSHPNLKVRTKVTAGWRWGCGGCETPKPGGGLHPHPGAEGSGEAAEGRERLIAWHLRQSVPSAPQPGLPKCCSSF